MALANANIIFLREESKREKMARRFPNHLRRESRSFIDYAKARHPVDVVLMNRPYFYEIFSNKLLYPGAAHDQKDANSDNFFTLFRPPSLSPKKNLLRF